MTRKPKTKNTGTKRKRSSAGDSLVRGLRQAIEYDEGRLEGAVEVFEAPAAVDVGKIREQTGLSQLEFANRYGFNLRSLQDWEQRRRTPDSAARAYLVVIAHDPQGVAEALLRRAS